MYVYIYTYICVYIDILHIYIYMLYAPSASTPPHKQLNTTIHIGTFGKQQPLQHINVTSHTWAT